jgi:ribosomal protein S27AE
MILQSTILSHLWKIQDDHYRGLATPCPRCGDPLAEPLQSNPVSNHALVYVCAICAHQELVDPRRMQIQDWFFAQQIVERPRPGLKDPDCQGGRCGT